MPPKRYTLFFAVYLSIKRRQKHSPSASIDDDQMEDTNEEETKKILPKAKSDFVREVEQLKRAIRKKDDFKEKLKNPVIVGRYKEEAVQTSETVQFLIRFTDRTRCNS